jgi:hypothetical protein
MCLRHPLSNERKESELKETDNDVQILCIYKYNLELLQRVIDRPCTTQAVVITRTLAAMIVTGVYMQDEIRAVLQLFYEHKYPLSNWIDWNMDIVPYETYDEFRAIIARMCSDIYWACLETAHTRNIHLIFDSKTWELQQDFIRARNKPWSWYLYTLVGVDVPREWMNYWEVEAMEKMNLQETKELNVNE